MSVPVITFIDASGNALTLENPLNFGEVDAGSTSYFANNPISIWNSKASPSGVSTIESVKLTTITMSSGYPNGGENVSIADGREAVENKWVQIKSSGIGGCTASGTRWGADYPEMTDDAESSYTAIGGTENWHSIGSINPSGYRNVYFRVSPGINSTPVGSNNYIQWKTRVSFTYV